MSVTLKDVGSGYKRTAINSNFDAIEAEINNNLLSKNGGVGLEADLDFNSQKGINLSDGVNNKDAVTVGQLNGALAAAGSGLIASQIETQTGADATANVFTFSGITYTVGGNNLYVFRNGNKQSKGRDYTETSSSSITLTYTPNGADNFDFITNVATTNSVTTTAAITHSQGGVDYNLADYLSLSSAGVRTFESFGAVGDGVTNDQPAFQEAFEYQQQTGCKLLGSTGAVYLLSTVGQNQVLIENANILKPVIVDFNHSTIKRGDNTITLDFQSLISFRVKDATPVTLKVDMKNLNIDDNLRGQSSKWEHNHCLSFTTRLAKGVDAKLENITGSDVIADMVSFGGDGPGTFGDVYLTNIEEVDRDSGSYLNRSSITLTGIWNTLNISNCSNIDSIQAEVNNSSYQVDERLDTNISNCTTARRLDIDADDTDMPLTMSGVVARGFVVFQSCVGQISNCQFYLDQTVRLIGDDTNRAGEYHFSNCKFYANSGFTATLGSLFYTSSEKPDGIHFHNCSFDKHSSVSLENYLDVSELLAGSRASVKSCDFGDVSSGFAAIQVQSGDWEIVDNTFRQTTSGSYAIRVVSTQNYDWSGDCYYRIHNNRVQSDGVYLFYPPLARRTADGGSTYYKSNVFFSGNYIEGGTQYILAQGSSTYVDISNGGTGATGVNDAFAWIKYHQLDELTEAAKPSTGYHIIGQRVRYLTPTAGGKIGAVCTALGNPGTWKDYGVIDA